jgi:4-alpha-glucanotransferase
MSDGLEKRLPRSSGILLHPTSLPSRFGIGDLGPGALEFLDLLAETGQRWWQILPLGPVGYGNSPYQSYSSYAGNALLISPEKLAASGWLEPADLADAPALPEDRVEFDAVVALKERLLRRAYQGFHPEPPDFAGFVRENAFWLDDYALYRALKDANGGTAWYDWEPGLVRREAKALERWREELAGSVRYYQYEQFVFARQWRELRHACRARGVSMLGDLPIFVAQDSADVWMRPDLFWLDGRGRPTFVAGVPPDAFAEDGQFWGNPLYRWEAHAAEGYAWWVSRVKAQTDRVDMIRLDHFRGFEAYWEIPTGSPSARCGRWAKGPGTAFLEAVRQGLGGHLPLVAEDLGEITPEVYALRDRFGLPGMRVLQFGFGGNPGTEFHLPYTYVNHCIAYTGTHDNDTTLGWFAERPTGTAREQEHHRAQRAYARQVLGSNGDEVYWDVIRAVMASVADTVVTPLQDVLGLGAAARMNVPGKPKGNWGWRFRPGQVRPQARTRLAEMTAAYGRWNGPIPARYAPPRGAEPEVRPEGAPATPTAQKPEPAAAPKGSVKARPKVGADARSKARPSTRKAKG